MDKKIDINITLFAKKYLSQRKIYIDIFYGVHKQPVFKSAHRDARLSKEKASSLRMAEDCFCVKGQLAEMRINLGVEDIDYRCPVCWAGGCRKGNCCLAPLSD